MVEFVILLIIIMALCSGMLYVSRLLSADYWAHQEARYLAFEQEWAAREVYGDPVGEPIFNLDNKDYYRRPKGIHVMDTERKIEDAGGLDVLMSSLSPDESIWHQRSGGWLTASGPFRFVSTALALGSGGSRDLPSGASEDDPPPPPREREVRNSTQPELSRRISNLFVSWGVGQESCNGMSAVAERFGRTVLARKLADESCGTWLSEEFGEQLAENANLPAMFREYEGLLSEGVPAPNAVESVTDRVLAREFYSFFDDTVKTHFQDAVPFIENERGDFAATGNDSNMSRMINDMRYVGAVSVLKSIETQIDKVEARNASSQNWKTEKAFEDSIKSIINAPVDNLQRLLNPTYLPVPPDLGPAAAGLFQGMMRIALMEETSLETPLIYQSNKKTIVNYDAGKGLFSAITSRFNTNDPTLKAKFFLVTQPWHINRRTNGSGAYRDVGDDMSVLDYNSSDDEDDEARLRARVEGFWLLPTPPDAMLDPLLDASGLDEFKPLVQALDVVGGAIAGIKQFVLHNPFSKALNALAQIPGIGSLVPTLPNFPAVRSQAYPGSNEIEGDELMDEPSGGRKFQDYIQEQHDFNPEPKPTFN